MRRVPALLIVIFLACPLLFASLVTISLATWTLDRRLYVSLFDDARLFQVPDAVSSASWSAAVIEGTGGLQWRSIGRAAGVVLTPEYLRGQVLRVVNQVFDSVEGRTGRFDISVDAAPLKAALRGDAGREFSRLLAEDLPVGGSPADFKVGPGRLPVSRPSSVSVDRAAAIIQSGLPTFLGSIPDTVRVGSPHAVRGPRFHLFGAVLAGSIVLLLLGAGFLVAAIFVGGETRFQRLQWSGWPLLAASAGVFLIGLFIMLSFLSPWVRWGIENTRLDSYGFSAGFISALIDASRHLLSRIAVGFLATGGIAAGAALGLLAWSWSIPHIERKGESA